VRILRSYKAEGINTLSGVVNRWAPPEENDTGAYLTDICDRCSVDANAEIDIDAMLPQLINAIIIHENGSNPYDPSVITEGILLA
jgi:hypothetical protein